MNRPVYIGTATCGCTVAAVLDHPGLKADVIETVLGFLSEGLTVRRVDAMEVRMQKCLHTEKEAAPTQAAKGARPGLGHAIEAGSIAIARRQEGTEATMYFSPGWARVKINFIPGREKDLPALLRDAAAFMEAPEAEIGGAL